MAERPRVLIEDWLPVAELGIESRRERAVPTDLPPLFALHVWWARRPLVASAAVTLASVLPAWSPELATKVDGGADLASEKAYRLWFLRLCGIIGNPLKAKALSERAKESEERSTKNPFDYKPAFKNSPTRRDIHLVHCLLNAIWSSIPSVLDPTAGGGSIPFAAARYNLPVVANDLNPIAAAVLRAGVETPVRYGIDLLTDLRRWGTVLVGRVRDRLFPFFPQLAPEKITNFFFTRTVRCPRTGKTVPLAPNWWLSKENGGAAARLVTSQGGHDLDEALFEILSPVPKNYDPDGGTVRGGDAVSPWDNLVIEGDYIKSEAQAGRMGSQLYALAVRVSKKRGFRAPTQTDLDAVAAAQREVERHLPRWLADGMVPTDEIPKGNDTRPHQYGMNYWWKLFSPRQLLVHATFVEEFQRLIPEVIADMELDRANSVLALLAMMQGKALNYNSVLATWHVSRGVTRSVFDRHDFSFKWSFSEFEGAVDLFEWCLKGGVLRAYEGIASMLAPQDLPTLTDSQVDIAPRSVIVTRANAGNLTNVADHTQTLVCVDPPYYDNVMYAELSDFFLAWEQHTVGRIWPDLMEGGLSDKENEAVANVARFADAGRRKKELANADYEAKMTAIFQECRRVLRDDGVLTVMFTHKRAEAWDTLGMGLMEAGFVIETSWPVNTESEQSLHQANVNAAASTIMLVCRKRAVRQSGTPYFEDIEGAVREAAREAMLRFSEAGIAGVDLLLSTYGPALSVISTHWPVFSSEADQVTGRSRLLRPEEALGAARAEVVRIQRQRLLGKATQLDPITDFVLIAWDTFKAAEFPFDEAHKLSLATGGLDVDELARAKVLDKKSGTVVLLPPSKRVRRRNETEAALPGVRPDATAFPVALDGVHTVLYVAEVDGMAAAKSLIERAGLAKDQRFLATLQGLVRAIPRTKAKGEWVRPEAHFLDAVCAAWFPEIEMPKATPEPAVQVGLFDGAT